MPPNDEKYVEEVKLRLTERLFLDLSRLAEADNRSISDYVRHVLLLHAYGSARSLRSDVDAR